MSEVYADHPPPRDDAWWELAEQSKYVMCRRTALRSAEEAARMWANSRCGEDTDSRFTPTMAWLLRDIVGNPFRQVGALFQPLPSFVTSTAEAIYEERTFDHLPVLADALQDAGICVDEQIISHLRSPGPHVRGCWAVDLIMGRS